MENKIPKSAMKKEELKKRNEAKQKLLTIARDLFKEKKINNALFNKMWNMSSPASAYRLNTINDAIETLQILMNKSDLHKIKKKDFTPLLKGVKKNYIGESPPDGFLFYKAPNPTEILNSVNKYYNNVHYVLPQNYDYQNRKKEFKKTFNFKFDGDVMEISNLLKTIYSKQKYSFKVNISFGFTLIKEGLKLVNDVERLSYNIIRFKLFKASTNTRIFDYPVLIDSMNDIQQVMEKMDVKKLVDKLVSLREDSSWKFYEFLYIRFDVYELKNIIGKAIELPQHFKEGSNQKCLIKYENYDDYLCFWRCLAYHYDKPADTRDVNKKLKQLFNTFYAQSATGASSGKERNNIKNYSGVEYVAYKDLYKDLDKDDYDKKEDEIDLIEKEFKININIYTNDEPDIFEIDRRSINIYEDSINLLRYNNHFMYIKNMDQMRHCYKCKKCNKIFKCEKQCNRHETKCNILVKHEFKGGVYQPNQGVFKDVVMNEEDKYYPYEICYDFEAMLKPIEVENDTAKQLKITMEHVPVSVSILSNVPGYDNKPIFICNDNTEQLIDDFVKVLYNISKKAEKLLLKKYNYVIERLEEKEAERIIKWCSVIPVVSFNGSKYDINLMKKYLHQSLNKYGQVVEFAIKRSNSYMSLKTDNLQFLDIRSYLAPNYSYDAFIKAYKCKLEKGFFPYDWFNSYDKLNNTELPEHKHFYNKLKNSNITDEEYKICVDAWKKNNMKTFKDFLEWYNNLDVIPFVEAIEKMKVFYKNKKLDLFKDGVSLPGLVLKYLINSTKDEFYLFNEKDNIDDRKTRNNLFYLLKDSIVGGPSIIFTRYHEAFKTFIRGGDKLCKKVIGYDANALYLWAISHYMPTGKHEHIKNYDLSKLEQDILNDKLFGFVQVDIETPEHLKEYFKEMTPIFKNAKIKFDDIGEYMQNFHKENNIKFVEGNKLVGSYFGKEIVLYTPLLKWYIQKGIKITKFYNAIKYKPSKSFQLFADEVSDARRAGDVDKNYDLIAETMKLFGNSAYGKTITNKEGFVNTSYANENDITKKINNPRFKDLEELHKNTYEVTTTYKTISMDLPLQIGVAVYHLAKLRMLEFYYDFIDKYIDRSDYELIEMDTDSNYFAFSADDIEKLIKPELREQYEKEKYNFLPSESNELHPTFNVDGKRFTMKAYEKRTPGLFKVETIKDKAIALCSKMYCCSDMDEQNIKFSCKGIQKQGNNVNYKKFENVLFGDKQDIAHNKGFRYVEGVMKSYEQTKKGLSYIYCKRVVLPDGVNTIPLNI